MPNERCRFLGRSSTTSSGRSKTDSSKFAATHGTSTRSPAAMGQPPTSTGAVTVRPMLCEGAKTRRNSSVAGTSSSGSSTSRRRTSGWAESQTSVWPVSDVVVSIPPPTMSLAIDWTTSSERRPPSTSWWTRKLSTSSPGSSRRARDLLHQAVAHPRHLRGAGLGPLGAHGRAEDVVHGALERRGVLLGQAQERHRDQCRHRAGEVLDQVALAPLDEGVHGAGHEPLDHGPHALHRCRREELVQELAVGHLLGRVHLDRDRGVRVPLRDHDPAVALGVAGRGEDGVLAGGVGDVLVAAEDPEAAPGLRPGHRARRPEGPVRLVGPEPGVVVVERHRGSFLGHALPPPLPGARRSPGGALADHETELTSPRHGTGSTTSPPTTVARGSNRRNAIEPPAASGTSSASSRWSNTVRCAGPPTSRRP